MIVIDKHSVEKVDAIDIKAGVVFLIDKPLEWTSFDVVNKLRFAIRKRLGVKKIKVGHAGTLDPLATGLLIICAGKATKSIHQFQAQSKHYEGTIKLGCTTDTLDAEAPEIEHTSIDHLKDDDVHDALKAFQGKILQIPPNFSAIKKGGKKAYDLARSGKEVKLEPRQLEIFEFKATQIDFPYVNFIVHCSKGTYIRALARDLGGALKVGGYLSRLQRTGIGNYRLEDALALNTIVDRLNIDKPN